MKKNDFSNIVVPRNNYSMHGHLVAHQPVEGGRSYRLVIDGKPALKVPCFIIDGYEDWPGLGQFEPFGEEGPVWHFEQKDVGRTDDDGRPVRRWEVSLPDGFEPLGLPVGYLWLRAK